MRYVLVLKLYLIHKKKKKKKKKNPYFYTILEWSIFSQGILWFKLHANMVQYVWECHLYPGHVYYNDWMIGIWWYQNWWEKHIKKWLEFDVLTWVKVKFQILFTAWVQKWNILSWEGVIFCARIQVVQRSFIPKKFFRYEWFLEA